MRMLIVDDDPTNGAVMKCMASKVFGGEIHVKTSVVSAVKACHELTFDIIVTDYMMPDLSGHHFISIIREFEEYRAVPIIMTSGMHDSALIDRLTREGLDCFISKPFNTAEFRNKIEYYLARRSCAYTRSEAYQVAV